MAEEEAPRTVPKPVISPGAVASIAAALRRSASLNTGNHPTRTLRITASEKSSRDNTPTPVSAEDLSRRPRSNPRSRTPMRYESPLEHGAFRADRRSPVREEGEETRRVTIRPLLGNTAAAVGDVARSSTIREGSGPAKPRSSKQGPSQRKIHRWNNEHFAGLAAEISSSSVRGMVAADVLLKAARDAHLYRSIYDPKEHRRSEKLNRFMQGDDMKVAREQFFEGEGPMPVTTPTVYPRGSGACRKGALTAEDMLNRMDQRLRRLVVRACHNSYAAAKVVALFEEFVIVSFSGESNKKVKSLDEGWWKDLLLECPTITQRKDNSRYTAQFYFHATAATGGFHRLLLHAVCQFHGLNAVSKMERNYAVGGEGEITDTRALIATGTVDRDDLSVNHHRLLKHLGEEVDEPSGIIGGRDASVVEKMSALKIV